jgi:hypothetical protein
VKGPELERLNKRYVVPRLPQFDARRRLLVLETTDDLFRGIVFDWSWSSRETVYPYACFRPLYVWVNPWNFLSIRICHGLTIRPDTEMREMASLVEAIRDVGLPYLAQATDAASLAANVRSIVRPDPGDLIVDEIEAYSLVRARDADAERALQKFLARLDRPHDAKDATWYAERRERTRLVLERLDHGGFEAANEVFASWLPAQLKWSNLEAIRPLVGRSANVPQQPR